MKKLDRIMINEEFLQQFQNASGVFLPFLISDHSPTVVTFPQGLKKRRRSFRFVNYVVDKEDFVDCVKKEWETEITGCNMYKVVQKLKRLKKPLNMLNWKNRNLSHKVTSLKKKLTDAQTEVTKDPFNNDLKIQAASLLNEYVEASNDELKFLQQKAKIKWLSEGDQNTAYFHGILKSRKHKGRIESICDENGMRLERDSVATIFFEHFKNFLGTKHDVQPLDSIEVSFDNVISKEEAEGMIGIVTDEEIKDTVFDIDSNKAYRPDGYTSSWHIQDNILIDQELLKGYQWKKGARRCALKVNIQKAYDTVSWEFLEKARDPISPYFFTLVMEVFSLLLAKNIQKSRKFKFHYGCKELKLSNMCFADDLLVLCNGDIESVGVIKQTMDQFSSYRLVSFLSKSTIFFGSVPVNVQNEILSAMPFQVGSLPMKYLGVPLIAKKLGIKDCKSLVNKIYWASVYMLPNTIINEIEKLYPVLSKIAIPALSDGINDKSKAKRNLGKVINRLVLAAAVYYIWQDRNWKIFKHEKRNVEQILKIITENVKMRLMSFKVNQTSVVIKITESLNLK
ncbi:RNA-directed DNA polymerase, eukaryota, reverse transcriptase zinc-binding domain protein [Tanacetum coccineum]